MNRKIPQLQRKIEAYFHACAGELLRDLEGEIIVDKCGKPLIIGDKPPTITGLALAIGFAGRQELLAYCDAEQTKDAYWEQVIRAKSRVEEYVETRLFDKESASSAKFSLSNNFKGWAEKQESVSADKPIEITITVVD